MSSELQNIQEKLKVDKNISEYTVDELKYLQKPIGKALYRGRPKKDDNDRAKPTDRLKCEVCGKEFFRSGRTKHNQTKHHLLHEKMNKKLMKMLVDK